MKVGDIVKSLKGHDTDRIYLVVAVLNEDFILVSDGKYRKLDNPKQKRVKHVKRVGEGAELPNKPLDSDVRKICKIFMEV